MHTNWQDEGFSPKPPISLVRPPQKHSKSVDRKAKESTKKQRVTAGEGMSEISSSMARVAESVNAALLAKHATPQVFAIEAIEKHGGLTTEDLADAVECVMGDPEFTNVYVTVKDSTTHGILLKRKLEKFRAKQ